MCYLFCYGALGLPNVLIFGNSIEGFTQSCFDVFWCYTVFFCESIEVCQVIYKFKWFTINVNMYGCFGINTLHMCLACTDGKPSFLCTAVYSICFLSAYGQAVLIEIEVHRQIPYTQKRMGKRIHSCKIPDFTGNHSEDSLLRITLHSK